MLFVISEYLGHPVDGHRPEYSQQKITRKTPLFVTQRAHQTTREVYRKNRICVREIFHFFGISTIRKMGIK